MLKDFPPVRHIRFFLRKNKRDNISALSGLSAFFIILSAVPFIMFLFAVTGMLGFSQNTLDRLMGILSVFNSDFVEKQLNSLYELSTHTAVITAVFALWSAGKGVYAIADGIIRIYRLNNNKIWAFKRLFAMGYTLSLLVMLALTTTITLVIPFVESALRSVFGSIPFFVEILFAFRYVLMFVVLTLSLTLALKLFLRKKVRDKRHTKFMVLLPGSAFSAAGWMGLSFGTWIYVQYFSGSSIYGSLGTVAVYMTWIYFSMYLLLCGVQINYIYKNTFLRLFSRKRKTQA